jgi:hypothetical protein
MPLRHSASQHGKDREVSHYLYDVNGWPAIVWEGERTAYARHKLIGIFEDRRELIRAYDAAVAVAPASDDAVRLGTDLTERVRQISFDPS